MLMGVLKILKKYIQKKIKNVQFNIFIDLFTSRPFSSRLVRGEGEIIEEIVSREKHKDINKVTRETTIILVKYIL